MDGETGLPRSRHVAARRRRPETDATPIEGFDREVLDEVLGLRARGLTAVVLAALGYRSSGDFNATLPKSRLPMDELFTLL